MADLSIQPTAKFLKAGFLAIAVVVLALEAAYYVWLSDQSALIMIVPLLLFLWPLAKAARRKFTTTTISGDRLRFETGLASKTTRNIQMSKIQDVRVDQKVIQRIFNVGDLSIETAGETSRLTIPNVDNPQAIADELLNISHRASTAGV